VYLITGLPVPALVETVKSVPLNNPDV